MKLVHPNLQKQINFEECNFWLLTVENPREYFNLSNDLYRQSIGEEGNFVLSHNNEGLNMEKSMLLLYDFYSLSCNTKKTENLLQNIIIDTINQGDYIELISQINQKLILLNDKLLREVDMDVKYDELTIDKIVKVSNFKFEEENRLLNKIATFIDLNIKLRKIKLVIFVGVINILEESEIKDLLKQLKYMQIPALFVDSKTSNIECFQKIIIDKDLCEI